MPSSSRLRGSLGPQRAVTGTPMSERQQMALVMQMTSQANATNAVISNVSHGTPRSRDRNERGETPLHIAAIKGDHEKVKKILDQGTDPNVTDFAGWTPLHEACSNGWLKIAILLIEAGANVNAHGFENDTPLHDAASNGQISLVKYLLESGANPHLKNSRGKMPFDVAKPPADEILADVTKENLPSQRGSHGNRARDDSKKPSSTSDETSASCSSSNMETVNKASEDKSDSKETPTTTGAEKNITSTVSTTSKIEGESNSTNVSTSVATQEETSGPSTAVKRTFNESESAEGENTEDDASKRKKRKETEPVKEASKTVQQNRTNVGRSGLLSGTKPPGPASKTGVAPLSKGGGPLTTSSNKASASSTSQKSASTHSSNQNKTSGGVSTPGKGNASQSSQSGKSGSGSQGKGNSSNLSVSQGSTKGASDKKSPCASPKAFVHKSEEADNEDTKVDSGGPKVPPLKIVIPGGVGGAGSSGSQQEGDGSSAQRGSTKNRSNTSTLPYIIHVTDSLDVIDDEKRSSGSDEKTGSSAQRVLRSHRNNDGEREKDRGRSSPHASTPCSPSGAPVPTKTPPPYHSRQSPESSSFDSAAIPSTSGTSANSNSGSGGNSSSQGAPVVELHPRKRKIKASRDTHQSSSSSSSHQSSNEGNSGESATSFHPHTNPYQQFLNIRKQVERKQKGLFPVQPKPPQGFKDYLINRCSYVLKNNNKQQPIVNPPQTVPQQMREAFVQQENERHSLRVQHLIEKEKLVLAVEQEILRVHGKAARALANQSLAFSACTLLMDHEVYNVRTPEQEEKESNAQRSRYNGRLFLSWLQEVDDKWEKIKDDMLRRHRIEADSLHATQSLSWEWKMKEFGICDHKTTPSIDLSHVPKVHVSDDFDLLPA